MIGPHNDRKYQSIWIQSEFRKILERHKEMNDIYSNPTQSGSVNSKTIVIREILHISENLQTYNSYYNKKQPFLMHC